MPTSFLALAQALPRDSLSVWADGAVIFMAITVGLLAIGLITVLISVRKAIAELRTSVQQNLGPASDRARAISDNVEYITQVVRADVEKLNSSVTALSDRLTQASDRMEERIEEFNALMEVVQGEAEELFLDTASTVRGVREGAKAIANRGADGGAPSEAPVHEGAADTTAEADPEGDEATEAVDA